jgi:hypothetical protein
MKRALTAGVGVVATMGGLLFTQGPAAAGVGQPIPGVDIVIKKNPARSLISVGGQVYTSGGAVTDPDAQVRVFPGEPVTVVIGSTSGELVRSFDTDRLSYSLYGPSTGGAG